MSSNNFSTACLCHSSSYLRLRSWLYFAINIFVVLVLSIWTYLIVPIFMRSFWLYHTSSIAIMPTISASRVAFKVIWKSASLRSLLMWLLLCTGVILLWLPWYSRKLLLRLRSAHAAMLHSWLRNLILSSSRTYTSKSYFFTLLTMTWFNG